MLTVRSFLSTNAIRATNSQDGIDYCSTNNSVPCAVKSITVPVLFAAMGGYTFIRDNEIHYELAASKDKDYIVVEGATHGATPCKECEKTPGQYSNSVKNFFDYVAKWINSRFSLPNAQMHSPAPVEPTAQSRTASHRNGTPAASPSGNPRIVPPRSS